MWLEPIKEIVWSSRLVVAEDKQGIAKFKDKALQNEDELSIVFEDLRNTSDGHWAPTNGDKPQDIEAYPEDDNYKVTNMEHDDGSDGGEDTPTTFKVKRRHVFDKEKGKKAKITGGQWMQDQIKNCTIKWEDIRILWVYSVGKITRDTWMFYKRCDGIGEGMWCNSQH